MSRNDQGMDRMHAMNGKRGPPQHQQQQHAPRQQAREVTHSQHEDLIRYICDSWNKVNRDLQQQQQNPSVEYYQEPNQQLKDFQPFDLEALWGRRLHQNITQHS